MSDFDPELIEHSEDFEVTIAGETRTVGVDVYKLGGGTLGRRYEGHWGTRLTVRASEDSVLLATEDLFTGSPKSHEEVVHLTLDFAAHWNMIGDGS